MIKEATMLDCEEVQPMLRVFYQGIDDDLRNLKASLN